MPVYNFTTFDDPSASTGGTQAAGINDSARSSGPTQAPIQFTVSSSAAAPTPRSPTH